MSSRVHKRPAARLFRDDVVKRQDAASHDLGMIARCWHDQEDFPLPEDIDPLNRNLKHGEFGVSWFKDGHREILSESSLVLVDRSFQPGDFCKRSIDDVSSGVVVSIDTKGRLEHAVSEEPIKGWKSMHDIEGAAEVFLGDFVSCDDWIGQVVDMFDECLIQLGNGELVKLPEPHTRLAVGEKGDDILPPNEGFLAMFTLRPSSNDTVILVDHTVMAIAWLAINQSLDIAEAARRERPNMLFHGPDISRLRLVRGKTDAVMRIGDRVSLKEGVPCPVTRHGTASGPLGVIEVRLCKVKETITTVKVLWQDGTTEQLKATELVPYLTVDEYDVWPGDCVIWKSEEGAVPSVVQSVNAKARTAIVKPSDRPIERVPLLELDVYGTEGTTATPDVESLGVRRGDFVFIHSEGETNGAEAGKVPRIGEMPDWTKDYRETAPWRKRMHLTGIDLAKSRQGIPPRNETLVRKVDKGDDNCNWLGEVTDLHLDGSIEVTLVDGQAAVYPLERLTKLYDGMIEHLDEMWGDEEFTDSGSDLTDEIMEIISEDPLVDGVEEEGGWEDVIDDEEIVMDVDQEVLHISEPPPSSTTSTAVATPARGSTPQPKTNPLLSATASHHASSSSATPSAPHHGPLEMPHDRFKILPSAPEDHAFRASSPGQPSRNFMTRLNKEYRVLGSSLPESIIVRAYEDRADLLRSVIIGPDNTPYQDAPFMIDWMLPPEFPQVAPIAHFHSWTNGNGRVNPNLYEEGKVCLSILGTWSGDKNETWSAARSSLLQAFVSIQGLVLVKEPWFCEPAYDKLRGTEEGVVNSRLYNEKAYILSRNFVRRVLETPIGGLEEEIAWIYHTNGRLRRVIQEARALVERSSGDQPSNDSRSVSDLAVPVVSEGGIIMLERTLKRLDGLIQAS